MEPIEHSVVKKFMLHPDMHHVLRGKLHGGHIEPIAQKAKIPLNELMSHLKNLKESPIHIHRGGGLSPIDALNEHIQKMKDYKPMIHKGGSGIMGGSGVMAGSMHLGGALQNHKEMYHFALELNPKEFEMLREIAVQLLGGKPSPMWGKLTDEEPLESKIEQYEHIYRMPNSHAAAKLIEAEYGHGRGGGFGKAFKHVARIGSKIYKAGHHALKFVTRNKDLLLNAIPSEYRGDAEMFLETANKIDAAVNPIVDATIDAVKENATQQDKNKLKQMAEDSIKKVVEERVPKGKEILKLADDLKDSLKTTPIYAQ